MVEKAERPVGLTRSVGYQIGVRRTLNLDFQRAWRLLTSPRGVAMWLGTTHLEFIKGARYRLENGAHGEVRVVQPDSHVRITWQPGNWPRASTIQVRVIPRGERCVIAFHQEHLPDPAERAERRTHYRKALDDLERIIRQSNPGGSDHVLDDGR